MSRLLILAVVAFFGAQVPVATRASTIQYDLTLTPTIGTIGGSGYFDVTAPLNVSGSNVLTAFSVSVDGQNFTLNDAVGAPTATFSSGLLTGLNYVGDVISGLNLDILGTGGLTYAFLDLGTGATVAVGTISAAVASPSATPLPGTTVLFITGLLGLMLAMTRRRRTPAQA
jgi:hypothetical protein